jgi:undecaprenyl-diphosphatase
MLLAVLATALTFAVVHGWTQPIDDAVLSWMRSSEESWLVAVSEGFDRLGSVPVVLAVIAGGFLWLVRAAGTRVALLWLVTVVAATALSEVIEDVIARPRPPSSLIVKTSYSYPSGHAMVSGGAIGIGLAAIASLLWPNRRRFALFAGAFYAVAASVSRLYLRAHWMTDVVAGLVMGGMVVALGIVLLRRLLGHSGKGPLEQGS